MSIDHHIEPYNPNDSLGQSFGDAALNPQMQAQTAPVPNLPEHGGINTGSGNIAYQVETVGMQLQAPQPAAQTESFFGLGNILQAATEELRHLPGIGPQAPAVVPQVALDTPSPAPTPPSYTPTPPGGLA